MAWKKDIAILTAGNVKVTPDARLRLVGENYDLELKDLVMMDAGEYVCQVATLLPIEITHTLEILIPPKILQITSGGLVEVKKGSRVTLECKASGNPPPTITWTRKNNLVMAGKKSVDGPSLMIEQTNRHHAGTYMCTADNGVGAPITREITLNILYAPEIDVEKSWVHSGIGIEAHLVCIVHAHPAADVKWFRSTLRLEPTELHRVETRGSRHSLIFSSVQKEDFANYTCQADNAQGKTRQHVVLSGNPHVGVFRSPAIGKSRDSYNISWTVQSYTPIDEYRLFYRKAPQGGRGPVVDTSPGPQRKTSRRTGVFGQLRDWTDVVLQGDQGSSDLTHENHYLIRNLEPSTEYEAKVQAKNIFGWNEMSDPFRFTTRGMDGISREPTPEPAILPEAEMRDLGVKAKGCGCQTQLSWTTLILLIVAFT
ncbi:opioid-binding protein/cell adhesion molecule homolog isoform X2 [Rhodnius prolixus]